MSKSSKFILIIFLLLAIVILGSAYKVLQKQYRENNTNQDVPVPDYMDNMPESVQENSPKEETPEEIPEAEVPKNEESINNDLFLEVANQDCANKCARFKNDAENLKYCQNFCGLSSINKKITSCDALEGVEKDYCLKDMAITNKNFSPCKDIVDSGIKKTCNNRVAEEVLSESRTVPEIIN